MEKINNVERVFLFKKVIFFLFMTVCLMGPSVAHARTFVDALDLSPFIPLILDVMMMVATGTYEYFVGNGIIQVCVWLFFGITLGMYAAKMFIPQNVLGFMGMSGGGEMWNGSATPKTMAENILKPALRVMIALTMLLQIRPVFVIEWLVNPFLHFGSIYTQEIISAVNVPGLRNPRKAECPQGIIGVGDANAATQVSISDETVDESATENTARSWLSQQACEFIIQPVADLSYANNQIIKRGLSRVFSGVNQLSNVLMMHGGAPLLDIISGLLIVFTFVGCNLFMAMLIIQGILNLGMALILYPFNVLVWTTKPSDKWVDPWPAFSNIVKSLQSLVVTMIACAFILILNVALIRALLQWDTSTFIAAAGGTAISNVPVGPNETAGFGAHSVFWLSAVLTFYVMKSIFDVTREQLKSYTSGMDGLYNQVKSDVSTTISGAKNTYSGIKTVAGWIKKKK